MAEQLAFEQVLGDRRAVDRHECTVAAARSLVQPAREQFLAGPAGAQQHDRDAGIRHPLDRARDPGHLGRGGDQSAEHAFVLADFCREPAVFRLDPVQRERAPHDQAERVDVDRLLVEIVCAALDRGERAFARAVAAGDDHLGIGFQAP